MSLAGLQFDQMLQSQYAAMQRQFSFQGDAYNYGLLNALTQPKQPATLVPPRKLASEPETWLRRRVDEICNACDLG